MTTPHTALVSDDLTGALDSAAPFARAGWRTIIATDLSALGRALGAGGDVVAVSLNSRETGMAEAASRARGAAAELGAVPVLFKKIDSRMKGHIAVESAELAAGRALVRLVVCPAIPELGRYVVGAQVVGHGIDHPIPVQLPTLGATVTDCPDARTDDDLDRIVAASDGALLVGARGLASALARRSGRPAGELAAACPLRLPVTIVVGSCDPATLEQVARLRAAYPAAQWIAAPDGRATKPAPLCDVTILQAMPGEGADGATVAARLADSFSSGCLAGRNTVLLTGGETAAACLRAMGVSVLHLTGEAQPGLPVSLPLDFPAAPHIVTKSGGFGDPDCLATLVQALEDQRTFT